MGCYLQDVFLSLLLNIEAEANSSNFGIATYNVDTKETSVESFGQPELERSATVLEAEPYLPAIMLISETEMDDITIETFSSMGLLTENGEFDFEVFSELPKLDASISDIAPIEVIESDNRTVVSSTTSTPWRWTCYLAAKFPNGNTYRGTAFTMGPSIVGTCGHNLYSSGKGGWATSVAIIAARNDSSKPYGTAAGTTFHVGQGWYDSGAQNEDWGMVELSSNLGDTVGYFGM